ncbi:16S rRNA (adenine(1518)-N(6)/adenine(1519)-N(6))-dimethyltransferase RsmA [Riemerella anatipestifer]|uniref:16S rRNA (adenine(1518)-N(6)/adenine(1519)-N(6))- dimethyltransferase RsmA n=1 Tax=Riemerella anatipestifer TaxID=34085 RepID=UPI0007EDB8FC|nr:16S rRNA (adenine(1518)-N(6)/adenine(1519)-N(6))-dimethyltransferase RsmA [Riemerella anatipestifer]AZZ59524.1 16S rRNA (adenine(1518)-N(6)/adenine(1519)-N(6))-dimethyltransferase RsmA [Riemerella anatipestifer]MCW0511657.1 16S rRNA (adenine(1518)-N(6)/adenine(1519)-N(6))-dimethyltransferase RsmA [Riemerella anatipestifer]MCW0520043.1 16S rRNA (adenine(1518)-N(6)/adenine(1519)-N(6))-dimethyltransferase RsmA [Riemerella anatipestifer]MDY3391285.1 16S rRNA (adenine(1518)-N(6)/adenine(1519)-N(6
MTVKAKKHLGQHFLNDENIASKIVEALEVDVQDFVLEVGPGMGVLTKYLLNKNSEIFVAEIDVESIAYLKEHYPKLEEKHFVGDFLKANLAEIFNSEQVSVIGSFPYNISSQILFKIIDNYAQIPEMVGMFQKEVAERTSAEPRTKSYGILSVMVQAYYDVKYLFTVSENVFTPPPKVKSGVIRLTRNPKKGLEGNEVLFKQIVKAGFNQRRKKLSNALKGLNIPDALLTHNFLTLRAEELSVEDFIIFTIEWKNALKSSAV